MSAGFAFIVLSILSIPAAVYADLEDVLSRFQLTFTAEETYDNNVNLAKNNKKDDFITTLSPGLRFSTLPRSETTREFRQPSATKEEKYGIDLNFTPGFVFYAKQKNDNYLSLAGNLGAWYSWDPKLTFRVRDYLTRSEEQLEKDYRPGALPGQIILGSQRARSVYFRNVFGPSLDYRFSKDGTISINYMNNIYRNQNDDLSADSDENYINPQLTYWFDVRNGVFMEYGLDLGDFKRSPDYTAHLMRGRYTRRFDPRTSVFGEYSFRTRKFDPQTVDRVNYDTHNPSIGVDHAFSRTFSLSAQLGYFWERRNGGSGQDGASYSLVLTEQAQRTTYTLGFQGGYTEDYNSAQNLGFGTHHQVIGTVTHQLTREATVTFSGRYQRPEYNDGRRDNLWGTGGDISYGILRWLSLGFGLNYVANNSNRDENDYNDFRATFRITGTY